RSAQPLAEADRNRVEMLSPVSRRDAGRDDGIPQAGPVEMDLQAVLPGPGADRFNLLNRIHPAAAAVVRVLQADQPGPDTVLVDRPNLVFELADIEDAVVPRDRPARDAAQD